MPGLILPELTTLIFGHITPFSRRDCVEVFINHQHAEIYNIHASSPLVQCSITWHESITSSIAPSVTSSTDKKNSAFSTDVNCLRRRSA